MNGLRIGLTPWVGDLAEGARHIADQAETAERLGFDSLWLPESHFAARGACPSPLLLLAAAAGRTHRLRLGTTSYLLPIRQPLQVAEDVAVLDQLSGGRVILGLGRGFRRALFAAFGVPVGEKRDRFDAALRTVLDAWAGKPIARDPDVGEGAGGSAGADVHVVLAPRPVQVPHPPLWVAAFGPKAVTQAGRLGLPYLASPVEPMARLLENYRRHRDALPDEAGALEVPVMRTLCVTRSPDQEGRVRAALEKQAAALAGARSAALRGAAEASVDDFALVGEPARVRDGIARYREELGLTYLIARPATAGLDPPEIDASLALAAELAS